MESTERKGSGNFALFVVLLAIPTVAFIAAQGIEWDVGYSLQDTALMKLGAIFAALFGLGLLALIKIAGVIAKGDRTLLVMIFRPLLHFTMLSLSVLMVLHAVLGMAAIYYGESALFERVHVGIMLALGIGALIGVFAMIRAQFSTFRKATTTVLGKSLEAAQHPKIWKFVTDLAQTIGSECPNAIVAGLEPNFYVTEANVICLDGKLTGRTMYISLPLARILSLEEATTVIGHELAHYKGLDTKFSKKFYPIYRGLTQGLVHIGSGFSEKEGGAGQVVLLPALLTLSYFLDCFADVERQISRERELVADNEGAHTENAKHLAIALVKVHAFSAVWLGIKQLMSRALGEGKQLINASTLFADIVNGLDKNKALGDVSEDGPLHPTDTHPPLSQRLRNLNLVLADVISDSSNTLPANPAINLVENADELEKQLTDIEHEMMIRRGEARIGAQKEVAAPG